MFITNLQENEDITLDAFMMHVKEYGTLDKALANLDDNHIQYYIDNEKLIHKTMQTMHLKESNSEDPGYTGYAPDFEEPVIKKIKYKGEVLMLIYRPDTGVWEPQIAFRSITTAMRYGRDIIKQYKEQ
jgi:hypothetical protein